MRIKSESILLRAGLLWCSLALVVVALWACSVPPAPESGAVVVHAESGHAVSGAGIEIGDTVIGWRQGDRGGSIDSPFDLTVVEQRDAPSGPVELVIRRGRRKFESVIRNGMWLIETRPVLPVHLLSRLREGEERVEKGQIEAAVEAYDAVAHQLGETGKEASSAWVNLQAGMALCRGDRLEEAQNRLKEAALAIPDPFDRAVFWERAGFGFIEASRVPPAVEAFKAAMDLHLSQGTEGPLIAHLLIQQCRTDLRRSGPDAQRALMIYRDSCSECMEVAYALKMTGIAAYYESEWDTAENDYRQGLAIVRRLAPKSPIRCDFLGNLGLVAYKKGDFDTARVLFREQYAEAERLGSRPGKIGYAANYLGLIDKSMGQYEEARMSYLRALEAFRSFRPGGVEEAGILTNLGNVAIKEEDYRSARVFHQQALDIRARLDPEGADVAGSLNNLGTTLRRLGLHDEAKRSLEKALDIKQLLAPQSVWVANSLVELGEVVRLQGQLDDAIGLFQEALEIRNRVSPEHPRVADILFLLGAARLETGQAAEAETLWRRAIAIIENFRSKMGASHEERAQFGGSFFNFYRALAQLLVDQGRETGAFDVIERGRTGALCAMLTDQNQVPPGVSRDLWFEKIRNEGRIRRTESQRVRISAREHPERLEQLNETIGILQDQHAELLEKIGVASPRFKSLSRTRPIRFSDVANALEIGTALVSFIVGEDRTLLMTVTLDDDGQASLSSSFLPVSVDELSLKVDIFRALINRGKTGTRMEPALKSQAERLFQTLIQPCREAVESADRIIIIPDGPLLDLPFAALLDPQNGMYLVQWKSLVFNPSMGVVAGLTGLRSTRPRSQHRLVAFGDPIVSSGENSEYQTSLGRLPGSRAEVENIAQIFGNDARFFLGRDATEAAVKDATPGATFVHFALHALADRRAPLESALFLSSGKSDGKGVGDDGVLKAFEIMNEMDIDAEVVTLSACGTAGGREVPGEGIVGLARAFQFAGARSVVVTQWPVSDQSTAPLMSNFYLRLEQGIGPAEALRGAQSDELALGGSRALPFNWAAFQVMGDWKETPR